MLLSSSIVTFVSICCWFDTIFNKEAHGAISCHTSTITSAIVHCIGEVIENFDLLRLAC
jgi:hypothetical protein